MERSGFSEREAQTSYLVKHTETGERIDIYGPEYEIVEELDLAGLYEHYKSTPKNPKYYDVDYVVRCIETGECLVVYWPLYETTESVASARPLSMFAGSTEVGGRHIPRFQLIRFEM